MHGSIAQQTDGEENTTHENFLSMHKIFSGSGEWVCLPIARAGGHANWDR